MLVNPFHIWRVLQVSDIGKIQFGESHPEDRVVRIGFRPWVHVNTVFTGPPRLTERVVSRGLLFRVGVAALFVLKDEYEEESVADLTCINGGHDVDDIDWIASKARY